MNIIIIIAAIVLALSIAYLQKGRHKVKIEEEINALGGEILNIERGGFFTGMGPFKVVGKGRIIYKIEYRLNDEVKEGWVRFGGLFGPDWRL